MTPFATLVALLLLAGQSGSITMPAQNQTPPPTVRVWGQITPPVVKTRVNPVWPSPGVNDTQGIILLDVWIDEHGDVMFVQVVRSIPMNDAAAVTAVRQWKFSPALYNGQPIAVVQLVQVRKTVN